MDIILLIMDSFSENIVNIITFWHDNQRIVNIVKPNITLKIIMLKTGK